MKDHLQFFFFFNFSILLFFVYSVALLLFSVVFFVPRKMYCKFK